VAADMACSFLGSSCRLDLALQERRASWARRVSTWQYQCASRPFVCQERHDALLLAIH
jgi:hypothetical protein